MKTRMIYACVIISAFASFAQGEGLGRFQLFSATIITSSDDGESTVSTLFRVDTATGRVWKFVSAVRRTKVGNQTFPITCEGWIEVSSDFVDSVNKAGDFEKSLPSYNSKTNSIRKAE